MTDYQISDYFIHFDLIRNYLGNSNHQLELLFEKYNIDNFQDRSILRSKICDLVVSAIKTQKTLSIEEALLENKLEIGQFIISNNTYYFKKIKKNEPYEESQKLIHSKIEFTDKTISIKGEFNTRHCTNMTGIGELSGRKRIWFLAVIKDMNDTEIIIRPIIFGHILMKTKQDSFDITPSNYLRIHPEDIDEFSKVSTIERVIDDKILKPIAESNIKLWFAELLNINDPQKDWGGETSDLYTSHIHYKGKRIRAAILFKGKSKFKPMQIGDLGKNGDQINRLFSESADVYVLQHIYSVTSSVEKMMEAYASRYFCINKFMIIDGWDTIRILKAYGKI